MLWPADAYVYSCNWKETKRILSEHGASPVSYYLVPVTFQLWRTKTVSATPWVFPPAVTWRPMLGCQDFVSNSATFSSPTIREIQWPRKSSGTFYVGERWGLCVSHDELPYFCFESFWRCAWTRADICLRISVVFPAAKVIATLSHDTHNFTTRNVQMNATFRP